MRAKVIRLIDWIESIDMRSGLILQQSVLNWERRYHALQHAVRYVSENLNAQITDDAVVALEQSITLTAALVEKEPWLLFTFDAALERRTDGRFACLNDLHVAVRLHADESDDSVASIAWFSTQKMRHTTVQDKPQKAVFN